MALSFKEEVGERLRFAREAAGISANRMAERLSMSPQAIYAYENGQNLIPLPALVIWARETGRSLDDFAPPEEGEPRPGLSLFSLVDAPEQTLADTPDEALVREVYRRLTNR